MRPLVIGPVVADPPVSLAPMAGVSSAAFRILCRETGAGLVYSEMVSAEALVRGNPRSWQMTSVSPAERPLGLQLFGHDPGVMARAAAMVLEREAPPELIDINMGCPVRKVVGGGDGVALMLRPGLACRIVAAVCREAGHVPVTVKIRSGWDRVTAPDLSPALEDAGAAGLAVHGRTRVQMYEGRADWDVIEAVKSAVSVPVVGNGDVDGGPSALRMLRQTRVDGVMVGRAALGNPWVFSEIAAALAGREFVSPGPREVGAMMTRHLDLLIGEHGQERGVRQMRKHAAWYVRGMPGARRFRRLATAITSRDDLRSLLDMILGATGEPPGEASQNPGGRPLT